MIRGTLAVAGLSWREAWRGRLWAVPLSGAALVVLLAPAADSADPGGAVRLVAAGAGAAAGFCAILLAALVPAAQFVRDLESRISLTALPKPLPRAGWLLGRWLGALLVAGAAAGVVAVAGSAAVAWRAGGMPQMRSAAPAGDFVRLSALGEAVAETRGVVRLAGPQIGDGVRWRFSGLPRRDGEVLVRGRVSAAGGGLVESAAVRVAAIAPDGSAIPLALAEGSPYGRRPAEGGMPGANLWLADRGPDRTALGTDWARLNLPAQAIGADGTLTVQADRLDPGTVVVFEARGCVVAESAGPQPLHALRAVAAELAGPAVVAAAALAVAAVASLPVALLAALALAVGGHAHWAIRETIEYQEASRPVLRILGILSAGLPDLAATGQSARLAAGEAIGWDRIAAAWLAVAPHLAALLALGCTVFSRRELR
jgi:hypothetical protein